MHSKPTPPPKTSTIANTSANPSHTPPTPTTPSHTPTPLTFHFPTLPLPIQQQFDRLQLSTNMQIELLASTFTQRLDQLVSLYQSSLQPPPYSHVASSPYIQPPPTSFSLHQRPPLFTTTQPNPNLPEFGSFRGLQIRLDTPKFDGTDPAGWLYRIGEYFDFYATPHHDRLRLVGLRMEGQAFDWFRWTRNNGLLHSWEDFVSQVQVRFNPDHFEDYVGALSKLRHSTTVSAYQSDFERLLNKVTGVFESTLILVFISGLKPQLRRELNLRRPSTLTVTFALASELSALQLHVDASSTPQPATSDLPLLKMTTDPPLSIPAPLPTHPGNNICRITAAEEMAKDAQCLCYWCDQKWSRSHRCQSRLLLLFSNDELDDDNQLAAVSADQDDELVADDISLMNSLSSATHLRSLRLKGTICTTPVHILIDGGSNHNFIHLCLVESLKLPVQPVAPFRVYVGNGDSLKCSQQCPVTPLTMQGYKFSPDLFFFPIHGSDIILGIQWLQMLGTVAHNYVDLTMEFDWEDNRVCLQGDTSIPRSVFLNLEDEVFLIRKGVLQMQAQIQPMKLIALIHQQVTQAQQLMWRLRVIVSCVYSFFN